MIDVMLMPGEYFVGDARHRIRTLLGSCVSITLWHPRKRIGAMSHFLLSVRGRASVAELNGRYGEDAMALMVDALQAAGVKATECQAKIFGGGIMFPAIEQDARASIGQRNGETAEALLKMYHIPVMSESLFGVGHRHIIFDVNTGDVWVKRSEQEKQQGHSCQRENG